MSQASVNITQQFLDGQVVPANLAGQDAASKRYVDEQLADRDQVIDDNAATMTDHINDTEVHISQVEREKLDTVQAGAQPNQNAFSIINSLIASNPTDTVTFKSGTGITISFNPSTKEITWTATGDATPGPHGESHDIGGSDPIPDLEDLRDEFDAHLADFAAHEADYVRQPAFAVTSGTSTAYTVTLDPAPTSLLEGFGITIVPHVDCGDDPTLDVNGLGPVTLKDQKGAAYAAGNLVAGKPYTFRLVGTDFLADSGSGGGEEVNGQVERTLIFSEDISAYDPITVEAKFTKLPDPEIRPTSSVFGIVFSPDDTYMAVTGVAPYLSIYKKVGGEYVKLADPATMPTGSARGRASFSPDGVYLAVAHDTSPYVTIYKRSGDTFTKLANPSVLPTGQGYETSFSSDGVHLAVAHATTPFVTIYKRDGDTFTKLSNPATLPGNNCFSVDFSSDGNYLAIGNGYSTPLHIYKREGDIFTKLANPATLPTGQVNRVSFSRDSTYLAAAHATSPFITVYKRSGDTFNKLPNPTLLPANTGQGVAFSSDDNYLIVTSSTNPYIVVYRKGGEVFYKLPSPVDTATINTYTAAFNSDDTILAIGSGIPYLTLFEYSEIAKKTALPMDWVNSIAIGYAKESGSTDEVKTVVLTHH